MKLLLVASAMMIVAYGCGGTDGSGVPSGTRITGLSTSQAADLCGYFGEISGPERTVMCGDNVTITIGFSATDAAECRADLGMASTTHPNCTATVGQFETCFEDLVAQDPCADIPLPTSCAGVLTAECIGD